MVTVYLDVDIKMQPAFVRRLRQTAREYLAELKLTAKYFADLDLNNNMYKPYYNDYVFIKSFDTYVAGYKVENIGSKNPKTKIPFGLATFLAGGATKSFSQNGVVITKCGDIITAEHGEQIMTMSKYSVRVSYKSSNELYCTRGNANYDFLSSIEYVWFEGNVIVQGETHLNIESAKDSIVFTLNASKGNSIKEVFDSTYLIGGLWRCNEAAILCIIYRMVS